MKLINTQKIENPGDLDEKISSYYDKEMDFASRLDFELLINNDKTVLNYINNTYLKFTKISNLIQVNKFKLKEKAKIEREKFFKQKLLKKRLIFNFNPMGFKRIYKFFSHFFLNIRRNNSK